jgi:hypothetical protein
MTRLLILSLAFSSISLMAAEKELLKNGDFDDKLDHWQFIRAKEYADKVDDPKWTRGKGDKPASVGVEIPYSSKAPYVRIDQEVKISGGSVYRVTFSARGKVSEGELSISCGQKGKISFNNLGLRDNFALSNDWKDFNVVFEAEEPLTISPPRLIFGFADMKGEIEIRDVSMTGPLEGVAVTKRRKKNRVEEAAAEPEPDKPAAPEERTWTDSRGRKVTGTLVGVAGGIVEIKNADGKVIKVPLKKLSAADQEFVEEQ